MPFASCTLTIKSIKNENKGKLIANYQLVVSGEKKFLLDDYSAPKPPFMQIIKGESGEQIITFLNIYKNGIYFYNYENGVFIKTIEYEREGPDGILAFAGYYIKNMDSIYVYNKAKIELLLTDSSGHIKQRISLKDNRDADYTWAMYFPQYEFSTVNPLFEANGKLLMTGMQPFSVVDSLISNFHFMACVDFAYRNVDFIYTYPEELYGSCAIWDSPFYTQGYPALSPTGEIIFSFPVSHDVYIAQWGIEGYENVYAGSNVAGTIRSINSVRRGSYEVIHSHFLQNDFYTGILHDPYRKVYYRLTMPRIPDANISTSKLEKLVGVIVMDENFNYMGETILGPWKKWNWQNSFVNSEGLMIEFFDPDLDFEEEYLHLKILTIENINN